MNFKAAQLFYLEPVTEAEAKKVGEYLVKDGLFNDTPRTVQIARVDETYEARLATKPGLEKDEDYIAIVKVFARELSKDVFFGSPVIVHVCDDQLKSLKSVSP